MIDLSTEYLDLLDDNHRLLGENGDLRGDLVIARGAIERMREKVADRDAEIVRLRGELARSDERASSGPNAK
jgi:hypothetical protein